MFLPVIWRSSPSIQMKKKMKQHSASPTLWFRAHYFHIGMDARVAAKWGRILPLFGKSSLSQTEHK